MGARHSLVVVVVLVVVLVVGVEVVEVVVAVVVAVVVLVVVVLVVVAAEERVASVVASSGTSVQAWLATLQRGFGHSTTSVKLLQLLSMQVSPIQRQPRGETAHDTSKLISAHWGRERGSIRQASEQMVGKPWSQQSWWWWWWRWSAGVWLMSAAAGSSRWRTGTEMSGSSPR